MERIEHFPLLLDRVKAVIIDGLLVATAMVTVGVTIAEIPTTPGWLRGAIFILVVVLYEPVMVSTGGTIGHRLLGLRVMSNHDHGRRLLFPYALLRTGVKCLLGWLSFLTMLGSQKKRAFHDMASNSVVLFRQDAESDYEIGTEASNSLLPESTPISPEE